MLPLPKLSPGPQWAKPRPNFFYLIVVESGHCLRRWSYDEINNFRICLMAEEYVPQVGGIHIYFHVCIFPFSPAPTYLSCSPFSLANHITMSLPTRERHSPWLIHRRETTMALPKCKNSVCEYRDTTPHHLSLLNSTGCCPKWRSARSCLSSNGFLTFLALISLLRISALH